MPETRHIEIYEQGTGKLIKTETYEVSDEELAEEVKSQRMANLLDEIDAMKTILTNHESRLSKDIGGHKR